MDRVVREWPRMALISYPSAGPSDSPQWKSMGNGAGSAANSMGDDDEETRPA
jgi:hypothetical protein